MLPTKEQRASYQAQFFGVRARGSGLRPLVVPPDVESDRLRRSFLVPRDLTAFLMGDPPKGWRLEAIKAPSIVHDALDDLIFGVSLA